MFYQATVEIINEIDTKQGPKEKRVKKHYLIEAVSVTDAEAKVNKTFEKSVVEFEVKAVIASKIEEVIK